ncbi:MAG: hypothetical protein H7A35_06890 [Planctomycetales bacterium]|nr:hypothetical protein [bacterium]UNM09779.1 MAG: hypothetical protein H7A35_06890 [Planctomycetales bacterium]
MRTKSRFFLLCMIFVVFYSGFSYAEDKGMYPIEVEQDYYGEFAMSKCPSLVFISEAPQAYFKVFGEWPETFQAIIDEGLIRDNLTIDGEHVISPDDGILDGYYDRLYIYRGPQTPPQIATMGSVKLSENAQEHADSTGFISTLPDGSTAMSLPNLKPLHVYAEQSKRKLESDPDLNANASEARYGGNLAAHKLMAIAYMCMVGSGEYHAVYGTFPANEDWEQFVDTGFCPVTSDMLNPATGMPFNTDGSPFSLDFMHLPNGSFTVSVHGDNGDYVKAW